jgi:hypothetical protein
LAVRFPRGALSVWAAKIGLNPCPRERGGSDIEGRLAFFRGVAASTDDTVDLIRTLHEPRGLHPLIDGCLTQQTQLEVHAPEANMTPLNPSIPVAFDADATLFAAACSDTTVDPISSALADSPADQPAHERRILIDASRDGGVWWFPQGESFDPDAPHQGREFAEYLRSLGYAVDELGRDAAVTSPLLDKYSMVIRAGEWGRARAEELRAYELFLQRRVTLVLLSDHRNTDPTDELAESLGVKFAAPWRVPLRCSATIRSCGA